MVSEEQKVLTADKRDEVSVAARVQEGKKWEGQRREQGSGTSGLALLGPP